MAETVIVILAALGAAALLARLAWRRLKARRSDGGCGNHAACAACRQSARDDSPPES